MASVKVCDVEALPEDSSICVPNAAGPLLVANVGGSLYAIAATCPHRGGDLSKGTIEGGLVTCPRHGAQFDLRTGRNVADAKLAFLPIKVHDTRSYPVTVQGSDVMVDLG